LGELSSEIGVAPADWEDEGLVVEVEEVDRKRCSVDARGRVRGRRKLRYIEEVVYESAMVKESSPNFEFP
jgi:hypothetical protein